jgi:hypothetical protein
MRRHFPDEALSGRVLTALVGWPALGIVLLLLAIVIVDAALPGAPFGVQLILPVAVVAGTLVLSYRNARAAGWPPSEAVKWCAVTLLGMVMMAVGLLVIASHTLRFGEG